MITPAREKTAQIGPASSNPVAGPAPSPTLAKKSVIDRVMPENAEPEAASNPNNANSTALSDEPIPLVVFVNKPSIP